MAELTLQEVFGAGTTQTATTITILKSDLDMTATATNRGEQIFAAICKKASLALTPAGFSTNFNQSILISPGFESLTFRTVGANPTQTLLQTQLNIFFSKGQPTSTLTPDDY